MTRGGLSGSLGSIAAAAGERGNGSHQREGHSFVGAHGSGVSGMTAVCLTMSPCGEVMRLAAIMQDWTTNRSLSPAGYPWRESLIKVTVPTFEVTENKLASLSQYMTGPDTMPNHHPTSIMCNVIVSSASILLPDLLRTSTKREALSAESFCG